MPTYTPQELAEAATFIVTGTLVALGMGAAVLMIACRLWVMT